MQYIKSLCSNRLICYIGKLVFAHKLLLAFRCPFLHDLVGKINSNIGDGVAEIVIAAVACDIFLLILRYIYCGNITVPPENLKDVMQAAIEFHLPALASACKEHAKPSEVWIAEVKLNL